MNAHALFARCPDGELLEIGTIGRPETAARLLHALKRELGDEYRSFQVVEQDPPATTVRALTRDELRRLG